MEPKVDYCRLEAANSKLNERLKELQDQQAERLADSKSNTHTAAIQTLQKER